MAESPFLNVIRIWAAMAWADGKLADAEASALRRLIEAARLTGNDLAAAERCLTAKVTLDDADLDGMSDESRAGIYRAACRIAAVDRDVAADERALLVRLRDALGLSVDTAREIEGGIPGVTVS